MRRPIADSRVLVTGSSGGLGRALALEFARQGAKVVLMARREQRLREVVDEIARLGGDAASRARYAVGDVTDPAARAAALDTARRHFGGLDTLVNNAGVGALGRFADAGAERLRRIMEINFFAPVEFAREALPLLREGRLPIIVNIGSILGHRAMPRYHDYSASKFALRGWSESVRPEFAQLGIGLLLVSPGPTSTEFWGNLLEQKGEVPWTRGHAIPAPRAAREILWAIGRNRREYIPGLRPRWFVRLNRWVPSLVERVVRRYA